MRGKFEGLEGKITKVDLHKLKVYIEGIKTKKVDGSEVMVPIDPSNLLIKELNLDDRLRLKVLERKSKGVINVPK